MNSGRLAEPAAYRATVAGPDDAALPRHGSVSPDARLPDGTRLRDRLGRGWVRLVPGPTGPARDVPILTIGGGTLYGDGRSWLIRPDGYIDSSEPIGD